jgi:hypothetical protein
MKRPFNDYWGLSEEEKDFTLRLLFVDYIDSWEFLKEKGEGIPLKQIIKNDMEQYASMQHFEACKVLQDLEQKYREDIELFE